MDEKEEGPLTSEQLARDKWRGDGATLGKDEARGHLPPASESGTDDGDEGGGPPILPTIIPPD